MQREVEMQPIQGSPFPLQEKIACDVDLNGWAVSYSRKAVWLIQEVLSPDVVH